MGYIRTGMRLLHSCLNWIFILNWTQLRQQKREEVVKVRDRGAGSGEGGGRLGGREVMAPSDYADTEKKTEGEIGNLLVVIPKLMADFWTFQNL